MSVERNLQRVETWRQAVNNRDLEGVVMCYAPEAHVWSPRLELVFGPGGIQGRDAIREQQQVFFDTWPDGIVTCDEVFAVDNRVVLRGEMGGTHSPPYTIPDGPTFPPTGNDAKAYIAAIFTIDGDGLIAENLEYYDYLSLVQKVGLNFP